MVTSRLALEPVGQSSAGSSSKPSLSADGSTVAVVTSPGIRVYKQHACDPTVCAVLIPIWGCSVVIRRYSSGVFATSYCGGWSARWIPQAPIITLLRLCERFLHVVLQVGRGFVRPADRSQGLWTELGDGISYAASSLDLSDDGSCWR